MTREADITFKRRKPVGMIEFNRKSDSVRSGVDFIVTYP